MILLPLLPGEMDLRSLQELLDCLFGLRGRGVPLAPPWCVGDATTAGLAAFGDREILAGLLGQDKCPSEMSASTDGCGGH